MGKKFLAAIVLSFSLLTIPAYASSTPTEAVPVNTTMDNANNTTTRAYATTDNNRNWGWLGLVGLLGLAGMRNRSKNPEK
jgi:MYXO-CTERM domain-containing protein